MAETVDEIEQGVEAGHPFPEGWQDGNGIEDASQIDQGQKQKVVEHRQGIEGVGVDGRDQAELGKEKAGHGSHGKSGPGMHPGQFRKKGRDEQDRRTDQQTPQHGSQGIGKNELGRGDGGDQQIYDISQIPRNEQGGGGVGEAVVDDAHQNQARDDELGVAETFEDRYPFAERGAEDEQVKGRGDDGGQQCLKGNSQKTPDLFLQEGGEG